jgi:hypothetical protein
MISRICDSTVDTMPVPTVRVDQQKAASFNALDDTHVTVGAVAECSECLLICRTVTGGDGLRDALKLDEDGALLKAAFVYACW